MYNNLTDALFPPFILMPVNLYIQSYQMLTYEDYFFVHSVFFTLSFCSFERYYVSIYNLFFQALFKLQPSKSIAFCISIRSNPCVCTLLIYTLTAITHLCRGNYHNRALIVENLPLVDLISQPQSSYSSQGHHT